MGGFLLGMGVSSQTYSKEPEENKAVSKANILKQLLEAETSPSPGLSRGCPWDIRENWPAQAIPKKQGPALLNISSISAPCFTNMQVEVLQKTQIIENHSLLLPVSELPCCASPWPPISRMPNFIGRSEQRMGSLTHPKVFDLVNTSDI